MGPLLWVFTTVMRMVSSAGPELPWPSRCVTFADLVIARPNSITAEGNYVVLNPPMEADWFYQSFCSAHLEQKHQFGEGIGMEDDIFFTNEEWNDYVDGSKFVGIGVSDFSSVGHLLFIHGCP